MTSQKAKKQSGAPKKLSKKERARLQRTKHERKQDKHEPKQKKIRVNVIAGWSFIAIGILILGFFGAFLFQKFFQAPSLSQFLPSEKTLGFIEFRLFNRDMRSLAQKLQQYSAYNKDTLKTLFGNESGFDFDKEISPWIGKKAGIAFVKSGSSADVIVFAETRSKTLSVQSLGGLDVQKNTDYLKIQTYRETQIYSQALSEGFYFTFLDRYVVFSSDFDALKKLIDLQFGDSKNLFLDEWYIKTRNNLVPNGLAFSYIDIQAFTNYLIERGNLGAYGQYLILAQPLLDIFPGIGMNVAFDSNRNSLVAQSYMNVKKTALRDQTYFRFDTKYQGKYLDLVSADADFIKGGHNFTKEFKRMLDILNEMYPSASVITEALIRAQKDRFFGPDISLEDKIYPLFENEYVVSVEQSDTMRKNVTLLLELDSPASDRELILKLKDAFVATGALAQSRLTDFMLGDDSAQEVITDPALIEEFSSTYNTTSIYGINLGGITLHYAFVDTLFVASNNLQDIQHVIDAALQPNLRANHKNTVDLVFGAADEVSILNVNDPSFLYKNDVFASYLEPFSYLATGKNVFEDGISTTYELRVKDSEKQNP